MNDSVVKYATNAAVGAAVVKAVTPADITSIGTSLGSYSPILVGTGLGIASRLGADLVSQFLIPQVSENERLQQVSSAAVELGSGAASFHVAAKLLNSGLPNALGNGNMYMPLLLGAASVAAGDYLYHNWARPMFGTGLEAQSFDDF